jgi:predicted site-specific integrase-resolvase
MSEGYAKVKDAAQWAGVSERTFRDWLKDGLRNISKSYGSKGQNTIDFGMVYQQSGSTQ